MMALCPLGILGSFFSITDGGLLFCWTAACLTVLSALDCKRAPEPLKVGGWILAGALFKWPIYLFWIFYLCARHWYFPNQKKMMVCAGILLSLAGLLPSIWWNASHDFATFRHVSATLQGGSMHQAGGNLGSFLGSQALLLSPILFILLLIGLWNWFSKRKELTPSLFFCGFVTLTTLVGISVLAYFQKIQGNWITFAYPTGLIVIGWDAFEQHPKRERWAKGGAALSVSLAVTALFLLSTFLPYRSNPLKHNLGGHELQAALKKQGYQPDTHFLVSDKYQTASLLSFYGVGQKRAYFLNLRGTRRNQFSYWPSLHEERKGQNGYFVWIENMPYLEREWKSKLDFYQTKLRDYFEAVHASELIPLLYEGETIVKAALIFRCEGCKEALPDSPLLY